MKLGFTTLALFMEPNNDIINLAKQHGFEIIGIREKYYNGIDGYLMERR